MAASASVGPSATATRPCAGDLDPPVCCAAYAKRVENSTASGFLPRSSNRIKPPSTTVSNSGCRASGRRRRRPKARGTIFPGVFDREAARPWSRTSPLQASTTACRPPSRRSASLLVIRDPEARSSAAWALHRRIRVPRSGRAATSQLTPQPRSETAALRQVCRRPPTRARPARFSSSIRRCSRRSVLPLLRHELAHAARRLRAAGTMLLPASPAPPRLHRARPLAGAPTVLRSLRRGERCISSRAAQRGWGRRPRRRSRRRARDSAPGT